jgi:hypothetical protein
LLDRRRPNTGAATLRASTATSEEAIVEQLLPTTPL